MPRRHGQAANITPQAVLGADKAELAATKPPPEPVSHDTANSAPSQSVIRELRNPHPRMSRPQDFYKTKWQPTQNQATTSNRGHMDRYLVQVQYI